MKTKIILFCMLALSLTVLPARATTYDYPYLALESSDGVVLTVEVEGLTFTIGENTLTAPPSSPTSLNSSGAIH